MEEKKKKQMKQATSDKPSPMRLHGMEGDHEARKRTDRTGQRELKADSSVTLQEWEVHGMSRSSVCVRTPSGGRDGEGSEGRAGERE